MTDIHLLATGLLVAATALGVICVLSGIWWVFWLFAGAVAFDGALVVVAVWAIRRYG